MNEFNQSRYVGEKKVRLCSLCSDRRLFGDKEPMNGMNVLATYCKRQSAVASGGKNVSQ